MDRTIIRNLATAYDGFQPKDDVIYKYGTPRCILTDNGTHFTSAMMNNLLKEIGVTHLYGAPYHPQTNGPVQRYNPTMDSKIVALSNERKTDWGEQLPLVTFNYNSTIRATTKQIPFEMMFGRAPILPFDFQEETISLGQDPEHVKKLNAYLFSMTERVRESIRRNQENTKPATINIDPIHRITSTI
ncbi:unnamed protein product [Didymodactylos carnosus]|uniref:Integrase catalytic domain-containing protein n=1 Tax=Didymodactylos carnosus TaxID=1234261 RepID=A0A815CGC0_9BILA|nr:unnamed protein product [Didymodactylos carnosus]CAF1283234.1 unnamed protein product [Didymodactylos carnosus]CAF3862120.1 unnamed protein product [Didymodactylos carnosus]CAF4080529.1 unnamed protein product [Didymodactylos carnosus]